MNRRRNSRIFILMAHDPALSAALHPVGVLGLDDDESYVSWLPYESASEPWRERLAAIGVRRARAIRRWMAEADGISWDIAEVTPPEAEDLETAVERTVDLLLAAAAEEEAS